VRPAERALIRLYEPGSWGPAGTDELIAPGRWHLPEAG
jgi:hypothetical protein